ncbi:hypothetical protein LCGC14_1886940, partial [marine sediment metagenome]
NFPIEINPKTEALPAEILIFSTFTIFNNEEIKLNFIPSKFFERSEFYECIDLFKKILLNR